MKVPIESSFTASTELKGRVNVIVNGHRAESVGDEYLHTDDRVSVNGIEVGTFSTEIDCASYAKFSPDGNPGIFRNNGADNPRNCFPDALVAPQSFAPAALASCSMRLNDSWSPVSMPLFRWPSRFSFVSWVIRIASVVTPSRSSKVSATV
jgi:hypothetical protein